VVRHGRRRGAAHALKLALERGVLRRAARLRRELRRRAFRAQCPQRALASIPRTS
jgi:hypothetical protein